MTATAVAEGLLGCSQTASHSLVLIDIVQSGCVPPGDLLWGSMGDLYRPLLDLSDAIGYRGCMSSVAGHAHRANGEAGF
ncbi:hypothetical protein K456DRAFT_56610 [Colletotrichum gloeosporioides 23]|nr:hypothetical protein K456DRAFT_56610 [Colletotrichum gloeosporioides 23]